MTQSYTKLISGETAVQTWRAGTWNWGEMLILFFLTAWSPLWMSVDAIQSLITNGGVCFPPFFFNATAQTGRCRESLKTESVTQLVKPPTAETSNGASDWEAKKIKNKTHHQITQTASKKKVKHDNWQYPAVVSQECWQEALSPHKSPRDRKSFDPSGEEVSSLLSSLNLKL